MKRLLILACTLLGFMTTYSQPPSVPFRIGNKFGIADMNGKMLVPAQFDIIDVETHKKNFFVAFSFNGAQPLSSVIYNNKIIIRDKPYRDYTLTGNLITATSYGAPRRSKRRRSNEWGRQNEFSKVEYLYGTDGKLLLTDAFGDVYVADNVNDAPIQEELLIIATDTNELHSLYVYHIKTKKITKTLFKGSEIMEMDFSPEYDRERPWRSFIYKDGNELKSIRLGAAGKKLTISTPEKAIIPQKDPFAESAMGGMGVEMPPDGIQPPPTPLKSMDGVLLKIAQIKIDRDFYYRPKKVERIVEVRYNDLSAQYAHIVVRNGKQGMRYGDKETFIIEPKYDEIYQAEFSGSASGYILRSGNLYGMYLYGRGDGTVIPPIFDKRPFVLDEDYFGERLCLIRLYDEQGNFFCYANSKGKVYYSSK
ncbi:MAG: hypothetical protein EOP49_19235 [Sphingobacteriales bacterium]|nr:MAG: hypothetical protein EOP49_19235 [Sphingobacteriales bacterium]